MGAILQTITQQSRSTVSKMRNLDKRRTAIGKAQCRTGRYGMGPMVRATLEELSDESISAFAEKPLTTGEEVEIEVHGFGAARFKTCALIRRVELREDQFWFEAEFLKRVPYRQVASFVRF